MSAALLTGRPVAELVRADITATVAQLSGRGHQPRLLVVTATNDPSSAAYVRSLQRFGTETGVDVAVQDLGPKAGAGKIRAVIEDAGRDPSVHGIILQTPLPAGMTLGDVGRSIVAEKDVDAANPLSLGRLAARQQAFAPATAAAALALLDHYDIPVAGRRIAVVGRSLVVGQPLFQLLLHRDATVTVCHSATPDLGAVTRDADIVIAAAGKPGLIGAGQVRRGAVVIDVGTNVDEHMRLVGDVDSAAVTPLASALSPVPGGVGAVTTALLFRNTVRSAVRANPGTPRDPADGEPDRPLLPTTAP